jgi:hypothetical protein
MAAKKKIEVKNLKTGRIFKIDQTTLSLWQSAHIPLKVLTKIEEEIPDVLKIEFTEN